MYSPPLYDKEKSKDIITSFGGYENKLVINENAFNRESNMSSSNYPVLSVRNKRAFLKTSDPSLHCLFSKEKIGYIKNGLLFYGSDQVKGLHFSGVKERFTVSMGTRVLIFPDKVYFDTRDLNDCGSLEAHFSAASAECSLCRGDGDLYEGYVVGAVSPESPEHGTLWVDTSHKPHVLRQYSSDTQAWVEIEDKFIRITIPNVGKSFKKYDAVQLYGFSEIGVEGVNIIYDIGDDYIVIAGLIDENKVLSGQLSVERSVPDMDFVVESGNRLWGCNSQRNEIYASKLGDPTNFYSYMGIASDSYAVTVGSDGDFTGAVQYRGYIMFFKENCVHKVYGFNPPYTVTTSYIRGVQKGSHRSICCLNETLYYKSPNGVCAFDGGVPVDISQGLGDEYYTSAVSGGCKNKLYISMKNKNGERQLFVYDQATGVWHCESNSEIIQFAENNSNLYFLSSYEYSHRIGLADGENIYGNIPFTVDSIELESDVVWFFESGMWGLSLPENKYYSRLIIRATGEENAELSIYFQYNSDGEWERQLSVSINETCSVNVPVTSERCDHFKLRVEGRGKVNILSISRTVERGSEVNVRF